MSSELAHPSPACETLVPAAENVAPPSDLTIRAVNLGKCYEIYTKPAHRLMQTLFRGRRQFYREFWALRDVSFEIRRGDTFGIIGRNGSGKSTLLQLLCGTLTPTTGSAQLFGRVAALLELGAGFNPQFTGRENVLLNGRLMGLSSEQIDARFDKIAAFADIGAFIDQPVKTYSSGMFVRLAFAVIAHVDPDILVIDEALAVGDVFFTQKCMRFLRSFRERGTIIFVSHDSFAVTGLCNRALWLDEGRPRLLGSAKEVSEAYAAAFYESKPVAPASAPIPHAPATEPLPETSAPARTSFGQRGATITSVGLLLHSGEQITTVTSTGGGETVSVVLHVTAHQAISQALVGFYVKDRLGQYLFGQNTHGTYAGKPMQLVAGQNLTARFRFQMPTLLPGEYTIDVAIADGTQDHHVQHHWLRDAYAFKSHAATESTGLVGIPMEAIELLSQEVP